MSTTNGWDAAYAMSLRQVNALFLQQYLQNDPTRRAMSLRVVLEAQPSFWILDVALGPPKLEFHAGSETATLEMELVSGALVTFDPLTQTIHSAARIRPAESKLTGPVVLAKTAGEVNECGRVVADLGASAYTPSIAGVDPKSVLTTEIGLAVQTFFAANATTYQLGAIGRNDSLPACLKPKDFHFHTQQKPGTSEACVLLFIHTNGPEGTNGPLATYPIPDGHTAALSIADRAVGELLVGTFNQAFAPLNATFSFQQSGSAWKVASVNGELNFGQFGREARVPDATWSSDGNGREQEMRIPCAGFSIAPTQGSLEASWSPHHEQHWTLYKEWTDGMGEPHVQYFIRKTTIEPRFYQSGKPRVDATTDEVTFAGEPTFSVNARGDEPGFIDQLIHGEIKLPDTIAAQLKNNLGPILGNLRLPAVNAFALTNLLFPARHVVSLKEAAIPGDLHLTGSLAQPIAVTPVETSLAPGKTAQFTATMSGRATGDVMWKISPAVGSIDAKGLYTAPAVVHEAKVVVVTAINRANASLTGSAMVLVYRPPAAAGVAVTPATALVTPGHSLELSTADSKGNAVAVTWTLTPNLGRISPGWKRGQYTYTAPASIATTTDVKAVAVDAAHPAQRGESSIRLVPHVAVTVSPAESSVKPGGSVTLRAAAPGVDDPQFRWAVFPADAGSVTAEDDGSQATFRAPAASVETDVKIVAYMIDDVAGMGSARVTVQR